MKAKIIGDIDDKGKEFKVRKMTYNDIVVNYPIGNGLKNFLYKDVELISEGEIDEFLINNMEFLKIKLNRGISVFFYKALKDSIEEEVDEELKDFNLLRDKYSVNKKGIWNKEIICMINKKFPIIINAFGQNFKREGYDISVNIIQKSNFIDASKEQISKIQEEIQRKNLLISNYERALENLVKSTD